MITATQQTTTDRPLHYQREYMKNRVESVPPDEETPRRRSASNYAAAFNALMIVSGIHPEFWHGLNVLLDKTRGASPSEWVEIGDAEAGALLPGDGELADESKARRWKRFWDGYDTKEQHYDGFEDEQKRLGKRLAYREAGHAIKQTKFDQLRLVKSRYRSSLAHVIVGIVREAYFLKDKREKGQKLTRKERFEEAAKIVWNLLPDYDEETKRKIKRETGKLVRSLKNRALNRFLKAAKEMIASAQTEIEIEDLRTQLHEELEVMFADAINIEIETDDVEIETETEPKSAKSSTNRATFSEENDENIEQIGEFSENMVYKVVHHVSDSQHWEEIIE